MYTSTPLGLCCFDARLRYVHINQWLAEINGRSVAEHLGRELSEVVPAAAPQIEPQLREVLETGEPILNGIVESRTGAEAAVNRYFQHNFYAVKSKRGDIEGV
jgi:hypothetical protein